LRVADGGPLLDASINQIEPIAPDAGDHAILPAPIALGFLVESIASSWQTFSTGLSCPGTNLGFFLIIWP